MEYAANGKTITTPEGKVAIREGAQTVTPPTSPSASFTVSPGLTGVAPFNISATSTSVGQSLSHSWDWGDGSPVEGGWNQIPHTYTSAGTYTITLIATQTTDGQQSTSTATIIVSEPSGGGGGGGGSAVIGGVMTISSSILKSINSGSSSSWVGTDWLKLGFPMAELGTFLGSGKGCLTGVLVPCFRRIRVSTATKEV